MEFIKNKKIYSISLFFLIICLVFFLQNLVKFSNYKLNWDEVDYVNVASKGLVNNYFDIESLSINTFLKIGLKKFNNSSSNKDRKKYKIDESNDNFVLRHFHPPLPIYYLSFFVNTENDNLNKNKKIRVSQFVLFILVVLFYISYIYFKTDNFKNYFISSFLLFFFISNKQFIENFLNFQFHSFFSLVFLYHIISAINYFTKKVNYVSRFNFVFSISLMIITLETFPFVLLVTLIIFLFFNIPNKEVLNIFILFKDFIISIIISVIMFPSILIKLTYLKTYSMYFYRIFGNYNKEYNEIDIISTLYNLISYNFLLILFIIFIIILSIALNRNSKINLYYITYAIVYSLCILPFMLSYTYIFPSFFVLIFLTFIILTKINLNKFNFNLVLLFLVIGILLNFYSLFNLNYKKNFLLYNDRIDNILINHLNDVEKNNILIDGAHIFNFYKQTNNYNNLNIYDFNNPKFYTRKNYQNIDLSEEIISNNIDKIIFKSDRKFKINQIKFLKNNNYDLISENKGYKVYQLKNDK